MQELFFGELKALEVAALTLNSHNKINQHVCLVMAYSAERKKKGICFTKCSLTFILCDCPGEGRFEKNCCW